MCKKCVQVVVSKWRVLWESASYTHLFVQAFTSGLVYTGFNKAFTEATHSNFSAFKQWLVRGFSTVSTSPITTTIYINNKEAAGGQKECL
jgi:hypothetical protein